FTLLVGKKTEHQQAPGDQQADDLTRRPGWFLEVPFGGPGHDRQLSPRAMSGRAVGRLWISTPRLVRAWSCAKTTGLSRQRSPARLRAIDYPGRVAGPDRWGARDSRENANWNAGNGLRTCGVILWDLFERLPMVLPAPNVWLGTGNCCVLA
ncbi:hypothetical protein, partial [Azotobacter salinestris]